MEKVDSSEREGTGDLEDRRKAASTPKTALDSSAASSADDGGESRASKSSSESGDGVTPDSASRGDKNNVEDAHKAIRDGGEMKTAGESASVDDTGEGKLWMYLDGVNTAQHGPFPQAIMLKLIRKGSAHKDMMAWSEGMKDWAPLGQVKNIVLV